MHQSRHHWQINEREEHLTVRTLLLEPDAALSCVFRRGGRRARRRLGGPVCGERDGAHFQVEEGDVAGGGRVMKAGALGVLEGLRGGVGEHEGGVGDV